MGGMLKTITTMTSVGFKSGGKPLTEESKSALAVALKATQFLCGEVGLDSSLKGINWVEKQITTREGVTYNQLGDLLAELERRINDELSSISFFHVPTGRAKYYPSKSKKSQNETHLSLRATKKFAKSIEDFEEAGKCFALARYTACIFHLMRVMERGVQRLGKKLRVSIPVEEKDWGQISSHINGALKRLPNSTIQEKKVHANYAKAAVYLDNVRVAWRNPTMHPKETYTEEEAEDVFRFVKQYMEHLAGIL